MLSSEQIKLAEQLSQSLDERQLAWLSGYFAGRQAAPSAVVAAATTSEVVKAAVLYGTQTGNGKTIAEQLAKTLAERGISADLFSMHEYKTARLKKEKFLLAVVSTHGEGDPPDTAAAFLAFLQSSRAPQLSGLSYSVLALGDSTYEHFCHTGRNLNARLRSLGASPLVEFAECDVDFETTAEQWRAAVTEELARTADATANVSSVRDNNLQTQTNEAKYDRQTPFLAPVLINIPLSTPEKRTRHLELSLEDSGLIYQPGDSLGIWPQNNIARAEQTAAALKLEWESEMEIDGVRATVGEWLLSKLEIARLTPTVVARYCEFAGISPPPQNYADGRDWCDLVSDFPPPAGANPLACARKMTPRMYSLASSPTAREGEAHILVTRSHYYDANGKVRDGVCSAYLGDLSEGDAAKVFVQSNENFRPPAAKDAPMIMIGPGTGVAPFRSFVEDRENGNGGKTWLFFGERRRREDFYYQIEWQAALNSGALTRMDVAFSRDRAQKVYVQHKLRQRADEIWEWLQDGAHVYVCGDEKRMAKDVHAELCAIAESHGGNGEAYWAGMAESGRYKRDVY